MRQIRRGSGIEDHSFQPELTVEVDDEGGNVGTEDIMRSTEWTSSSGRQAGRGLVERLRNGISAALMVVVQATFVASGLLLAPIVASPAGAAATSATLDQCANGPRSGPR